MCRIFINYRREDSAPYAGRLYDRLAKEFGGDHVFVDVDAIYPGDDFGEVINQKLEWCDAVLALIGKTWLTCVDAAGHRRLDNANDYVRLELTAALARNVRVIPVLVGGAAMPPSIALPAEMMMLSRRNAIEISDLRFHHDVDRLTESIRKATSSRREKVGIDGPTSFFQRVKSVDWAESKALSKSQEQIEDERILLLSIQASQAFHSGDYSETISILEPHEAALTKAQSMLLSLARKRLA